MAKADSLHGIPVGIPVSPPPKIVAPAERPVPKRKAARRERAEPLPWLWIVTAGSVAWALLILVVGLCTQDRTQPQARETEATVQPAGVAAVAPKPAAKPPVVQPEPAPLPEAVIPVPLPLVDEPAPPIIAAPKPAPVPMPKPDLDVVKNDEPAQVPAIQIEDNVPEVVAPVIPKPRKPKAAPAPARPPRKDADPAVYASCEKIGSDILFVRDPVEAFMLAKTQKKLVFMVHLSGHLEDKEFT